MLLVLVFGIAALLGIPTNLKRDEIQSLQHAKEHLVSLSAEIEEIEHSRLLNVIHHVGRPASAPGFEIPRATELRRVASDGLTRSGIEFTALKTESVAKAIAKIDTITPSIIGATIVAAAFIAGFAASEAAGKS